MTLQEEIKELRNRLDELENQIKKKKITGRYIPKHTQEYFYVNSAGDVDIVINEGLEMDNYRISVGNCFKTREEAEKHERILINTQKLKDLAERLNNGEEIDWQDDNQVKYYIVLDGDIPTLDNKWSHKSQGTIYCLDANFLNEAIEEIGEEELIELIRGE